MIELLNKGVRCGNHNGAKFYHETAADVRECYEWTRAHAEREVSDESHLEWMFSTAPDEGYERPARSEVSGWWDLPIAEHMWRADAAQIEG